MRIHRIHHHAGSPVKIITLLPAKYVRMSIGMSLAGSALAYGIHLLEPAGYRYLPLAFLSFLAFALGMGRYCYLIYPKGTVLFRLELLGFPVLAARVSGSSFHAAEKIEDRDGTITLRFTDSSGQARLTIDGFSSMDLAERVAGLFQLDDIHREAAMEHFIDESITENRKTTPRFAMMKILIAFCIMPTLVLLINGTMADFTGHLIAGLIVTLGMAYAVRCDAGIIAISRESGYIDRWSREGWFRITEYRQVLGNQPAVIPRRTRFDRAAPVIPLLLLAQAACLYLVTAHNERREAELKNRPSAQETVPYDSEAVRRGMEIFQESRKRREKSQ